RAGPPGRPARFPLRLPDLALERAPAPPGPADGRALMATPAGTRPRHGLDMAGLIWTLVRTDFKVRYHGTLAGFVWALLKPVIMFLVLMGVFSFIFSADPNYKLKLIIGLFLWDFFAEATKVGLLSLQAKGYLLAKTRFPRWILVATSSSN